MKKAAILAGEFLAAVQAALMAQQREAETSKITKRYADLTGDPKDLLGTSDVRIFGYRSVETEEKLRRSYFQKRGTITGRLVSVPDLPIPIVQRLSVLWFFGSGQ